ncbi:helix-turn-helix domain-containing protein [Nocardioides sp. zg-579]|uniref:Glycerol operon regulatory protein n=1 Tax=Nocardioides marmotae TaxID=2663857 RepID=A0A6I3J914_9ACTN|nr:helix-turn-helix domain-containing protein [Gordonia jinghuaiqii]MTB93548.1 helix-turn-helix domain-containing protein [Nocardioides marmotae]QKD99918.1 helix-turn-helix domain-containing protein [Nocardioides marmotae]
MSEVNGKRGVLARAFDILGCFVGDQPESSVAEICTATGLPPATVHRMLAALAEHGAIERSARGRYRLGPRLWQLGHGVPDVRLLRDCARPALIDLHATTRLPVALATHDGERLRVIDKIAGRGTVAVWEQLGSPALATHPGGLALLAWGGPLETRLPAPTGRPARPEAEFAWRRELAQVRQLGFAHSPAPSPSAAVSSSPAAPAPGSGSARAELRDPWVWAAAPVFGEDQQVNTCVLIGGRRGQHPPVALGRLARTTAQEISAALRAAGDAEDDAVDAVLEATRGGRATSPRPPA